MFFAFLFLFHENAKRDYLFVAIRRISVDFFKEFAEDFSYGFYEQLKIKQLAEVQG